MARTVLLDTQTVSFEDIIGNGKIYRVPLFQRDYSWNQENWEDLWADILDLKTQISQYHYMGSIILQARAEREFEIIDGQQRIATLSIFAIAIIQKLNDLINRGIEPEDNQQRADKIRRTFLGDIDPKSLHKLSKLFLNENNDDFYQGFLLQLRKPYSTKSLSKSNNLLWQAFCFFLDELGKMPEVMQSGYELVAFLTDIVARKLLFIQIRVEDELNAFTLFETLNARGIELSATDLLKNYLFSIIETDLDRKHAQKRWQSIINTIQYERFPEFLRYFLSMRYRDIRHDRLFKTVKQLIKTTQDVFSLFDELEQYTELFVALGDPAHELWRMNKENREYIRELSLFKVKQVYPVLFASYNKFNPNDFTRILKLASVITFRYTIVSNQNPNQFQKAYNTAAIKIQNGEITEPRQVFNTLRDIYISDENFIADFTYLTLKTAGHERKLARYILYKLETFISKTDADFEYGTGTIEHILPTKPSNAWIESFPENDWSKYLERVGNLTLLEESINKEIANKTFSEKKARYAQSSFAMTREINPDSWNPTTLTKRQEILAKKAAHLWRADFAE